MVALLTISNLWMPVMDLGETVGAIPLSPALDHSMAIATLERK